MPFKSSSVVTLNTVFLKSTLVFTGVMIMIHADNQGLVLPPRVADIQVMGVRSVLDYAVKRLKNRINNQVKTLDNMRSFSTTRYV